MMKFHYLISLGIAATLVVPAVSLQGGSGGGLQRALEDTLRALENLTDTRGRLEAGDPNAVTTVIAVTEAPRLEPQVRDATLTQLRTEVAGLQQRLDELQNSERSGTGIGLQPELLGSTPLVSSSIPTLGPREHTGLSSAQREALGGIHPPNAGGTIPHSPLLTRKRFEPEGFSANAIRQGQAYYRAGRYAEGLKLLESSSDDPKALYWSGRCLEKLGLFERALSTYNTVVDFPDAGDLAERAKRDVEFLEWRIKFSSNSSLLSKERAK